MARCDITPISAFQSTNLNNKIDSFQRLGDRIYRSLGYPSINVEVHRDQLYENINIAIEFFTKYAGYTKEFLIFDSRLYRTNYGIKLDELFSISNSDTLNQQMDLNSQTKDFNKEIINEPSYVVTMSSLSSSLFTSFSALSAPLSDGLETGQVISTTFYDVITSYIPTLSSQFKIQPGKTYTIEGSKKTGNNTTVNSFDYDVMDYRKVISVVDFEEGSTTGINTLFTIEQTLAQQTYFSYSMGNYGFDLISWYTLKEWLETREKLLSIKRSYSFDDRTQLMRIYPQPRSSNSNVDFYGIISCYVERPIRDVIKELWVYQYALALTKITLGHIRGKYTETTLFGGGRLNYELINKGEEEKAALESKLFEGAATAFGDGEPVPFLVG